MLHQSLSRPVLSTLSTTAKSNAPPASKRSRLIKPDISPLASPHEHDVCADDVVIDDEPSEMATLKPSSRVLHTPQKQGASTHAVTPSPIRTKRDLASARDQLHAYETIIAKKEDRMRTVSSSLEERLERVMREMEEEKVSGGLIGGAWRQDTRLGQRRTMEY